MATTMRSVDTRFWIDGWVRKLNALDRYVFLYFLTNPHSSWCGVYEVDMSMVSFETGIEETELIKVILPRLAPKIRYVDGWVYIPNFGKYHTNHSEKTQKGIENAWKAVPERIRLKIKDLYPLEGVSASASASASTLLGDSKESQKLSVKKNEMGWNNKSDNDSDLPEIDIDSGEEVKPKRKKKVTDDIQAVFNLFKNPAKINWGKRELERDAAQALFDTYGIEKLTIRMKRIESEKKKKDPYFPEVNTPSQLLDKMPNVERYLNL